MFSLSVVVGIAVIALLAGILIGRQRKAERSVVWQEVPAPRGGVPVPNDPEIDALLRNDRLIEAIKRHRELTGSGLKEAKDAMEARRRELR